MRDVPSNVVEPPARVGVDVVPIYVKSQSHSSVHHRCQLILNLSAGAKQRGKVMSIVEGPVLRVVLRAFPVFNDTGLGEISVYLFSRLKWQCQQEWEGCGDVLVQFAVVPYTKVSI